MVIQLNPTANTVRTLSGSSLRDTPFSSVDTPLSIAAAAPRTAAELGNLRYKAPLPVFRPIETSLEAGGSSHSFLPRVSGPADSAARSSLISWNVVSARYAFSPKSPKEDLSGEGVRAAARVESMLSERGSAAVTAPFSGKDLRRLSGHIVLAPLDRLADRMPELDEEKPS